MERVKQNGNLARGSIKRVENLDWSSSYWLLQKECSVWSKLLNSFLKRKSKLISLEAFRTTQFYRTF